MSYALKPLKWYKSLAVRKGRTATGAFLIEGERAVEQVVSRHPEAVMEIVGIDTIPARYGQFPARILDERQFRDISVAQTPQGIMAVVKAPEDLYTNFLPQEPGNRILLLEEIQDPGNTGTLIRTAAALGFDGIIMSGNCADPLSPKCVQSTAGSVLSIWIRRTSGYLDMIKTLKSQGYAMAAAVLNGDEDPAVLKKSKKLVLALGNEANGLSEQLTSLADSRFTIPVDTKKAESLNVASCGAICMYLSNL